MCKQTSDVEKKKRNDVRRFRSDENNFFKVKVPKASKVSKAKPLVLICLLFLFADEDSSKRKDRES